MNNHVICEHFTVQNSYWYTAEVTFSTVDITLHKYLPHHSLITVTTITATIHHPVTITVLLSH